MWASGPFRRPIEGNIGDEGTAYLWTIDDRGLNIGFENTSIGANQQIKHSNLSSNASVGGEAWFGPSNKVTTNAGSGRFGNRGNASETQYLAAIEFSKSLGYDVISIPFGL